MTTDPKPAPSNILRQNEVYTCTFKLHADYFDQKVFAKDFLELELIYEDVEMNLYHHHESFWLFDMWQGSDGNCRLFLSKDYEALHLMMARNRTSIASSRSAWWHGQRHITIYERASLG